MKRTLFSSLQYTRVLLSAIIPFGRPTGCPTGGSEVWLSHPASLLRKASLQIHLLQTTEGIRSNSLHLCDRDVWNRTWQSRGENQQNWRTVNSKRRGEVLRLFDSPGDQRTGAQGRNWVLESCRGVGRSEKFLQPKINRVLLSTSRRGWRTWRKKEKLW